MQKYLRAATGPCLGAALLTSAASVPPAARAAAHPDGGAIVLDWNRALLKVVRTAGAQPATVHATRNFAIVHVAIYNAVVSITHAGRPYGARIGAPRNASPLAAAAQAGHDALTALYPAQRAAADTVLTKELGAIAGGPATAAGRRTGHRAAVAILAARQHDGSEATPPPFVPGKAPGDYQLTPPAFAQTVFTHWPAVTPFVLRGGDQFRPAPYPSLRSRRYARAINEVKSVGRDTSTTRTTDQTTQARFWAAPIWNYWNEIAQTSAQLHHTGLAETARLFATLDLTFADAAIAFYDGKYHYHIWRPITAIRAAGTDGNPATTPDPAWNPLATTPADPSYPGAHSVIGQAGAIVLSAFFGPAERFSVTSEALPGVLRSFTRFQAAADEAGQSRIFAGIHTRIDHVAGQRLGRQVALYVLTHAPGGA